MAEVGEERRWLGIDFSGNHRMWRPGCTTSNVWIAEVGEERGRYVLDGLCRVQDLGGDGDPFERLIERLRGSRYEGAAIDAPFSVPKRYVPSGHHDLLETVKHLPRADQRPFPQGAEFVRAVTSQRPPFAPPKPLRVTEAYWQERGVNVRSTLWAGPRGGAAMTAACLTLLARMDRPLWPWGRAGSGLLVEAFPAAQLCAWGLPHQGYGRGDRVA